MIRNLCPAPKSSARRLKEPYLAEDILYVHWIHSSEAIKKDEIPERIEMNVGVFGVRLISLQRFYADWVDLKRLAWVQKRRKPLILNAKCGGRFVIDSHLEHAGLSKCYKSRENNWPIPDVANHDLQHLYLFELRDVLERNRDHKED